MNAKWMPRLGVAAGVVWLSACLAAASGAERNSLTLQDVDALLTEARSAIEAGNFDRANVLVERAESVQPKYSLFHLGPTPALVRRELERAEKAAGRRHANHPTLSDSVKQASYDQPANSQLVDPFAARMMPPANGPAPQPFQPNAGGESMSPVVPALHTHPIGVPDMAVEQAGTMVGQPYPLQPNNPSSEAYGAHPSDRKAEAKKLLRAARAALTAGDLAQAEELVRSATATGVPESAYLPSEDRPSLLSWDIQRARTQQPGSPAASRAAAVDDRYAAQASLDAELNSAEGPKASMPSLPADEQLALSPEPLELPSDAAQADRAENQRVAPHRRRSSSYATRPRNRAGPGRHENRKQSRSTHEAGRRALWRIRIRKRQPPCSGRPTYCATSWIRTSKFSCNRTCRS